MSIYGYNPRILDYPDDANPLLETPCPISHNWPQEDFGVSIYSGISFIKRLKKTKGGNGGGARGQITNFSRQSRKRLLERMAKSRNMDAGYFTTFTYPGLFEYTKQDCKSHLAALRKRISRRWPKARFIWRMEIKIRLSGDSEGIPVPHYHILLFGLPYGREKQVGNALRLMWDAIANYHDRDVPILRVDCSQIRSRKHAMYYAGKYAAKIDDGQDTDYGRQWGFVGEWDESMSALHIITGYEMIQLKRLVRSWLKSKGKHAIARLFARIKGYYGLSIFGLGDSDDLTGATTTIIDMIIGAQRQTQR